jgi:predicted phage terminase large subunit-like protein
MSLKQDIARVRALLERPKAIAPATDGRAELPLLDFIPAISPSYVAPRHLAPLIEQIERAEREPIRLLVSTPPRHAKTETILHGIARQLARRPSTMFGYASFNNPLALEKSRAARDYAAVAGVKIRRDADAASMWRTVEGGGLYAGGISSTWTGRGIQTLIVDDPLKDREQAESRVYRDAAYNWLTSTALSRIEPGGSVIVCQQRWHQDDLIGRLLAEQGETWTYLNLPAIDDDGEALWPERWPIEALQALRLTLGEYNFASQYLGSPRVRGAQLFRDPVRYTQPQIAGSRILIGVDVAITAKTRADYAAACVLAVSGSKSDMRADVLEVFRAQMEAPQLCVELEKLQRKYNAPLVVESNGVGAPVIQLLKAMGNGKLRVVPYAAKGDKFLRAQSVAAGLNAGNVRIPSTDSHWIRPFLAEVLNFTGVNDDHDDQVDALGHAWNFALSTAPIRPVQIERGMYATSTGPHVPRDGFGRPIRSAA